MTPRERVLASLRFEPTDRPACDLMEGFVWEELMEFFRATRGLGTAEQVQDFLATDFRWIGLRYQGPGADAKPAPAGDGSTKPRTGQFASGPLSEATTIADVEGHAWPDPAWWQPEDFASARQKWPQYALVFGHSWMPLFWSACIAFGMANALVAMHTMPAVFEAFVARQHALYMDILRRSLCAARGVCDACWLGDDYASQENLLFSPELWRKLIKPYLAEQVALARHHGLHVLFHSCGNIRPILPDLIDIGVSAHLVFQTSARGMDAESVARDFGGRMAFYGGVDIQRVLSFATVEEVKRTVRANLKAFERCGGYVVANSHHRVATIRGENVEAMFAAAREAR